MELSSFAIYDLGSSPILFILLGGGFIMDSIRRTGSDVRLLSLPSLNRAGRTAFTKILIAGIVYVIILLYYNTTIANISIAIPTMIYLLYHLHVSYDWHFVYFILVTYLPIALFPSESLLYLSNITSSLENVRESQFISVIAAFFAFISWREVSMEGEYKREAALRDRVDEIHLHETDSNPDPTNRDKIEYQGTIESVRVLEKRGIVYSLFKYFLLVRFQGTTVVEISLENDTDPNMLSVISSIGISHTSIDNILRTERGNYRIWTKSTEINAVEYEVKRAFSSICNNSHSRETLDLGEHAYPDIAYRFPKGVVRNILCRKERSLLRRFSTSDLMNFRIRLAKTLGRSRGLGNTTPLLYSVSDHDSRFYRTLSHLVYMNISWKVAKKRVEMMYADDYERKPLESWEIRRDKPLYEGLYLLLDAYIYHDILDIHGGNKKYPSRCTFITIHSNRSDREWANVDIPIENFHIDEINNLSVNKGNNCLDHFPDEGLDASHVLRNRGSFYSIYPVETYGYILARWEEINRPTDGWDGWRTPHQVSLLHVNTLSSIDLDGMIWRRTDLD